MATNTANIPKVFSQAWEKLLEKELNIGAVASRKYDAELSKSGDTVSIPIGFDPTVDTTYTGNAVVAQELVSTTSIELKINNGGSFNFALTEGDYLQVVNSPQLLADSVKRAIYKCRNEMDAALGALYTDAGIIGNTSSVTVSTSNAYEILMHMNYLMDEALVEKENRFAIVPSRFMSFIKGEIKSSYESSEAFKVFGSSYMGKIDNLNIITSEEISIQASKNFLVYDTPLASILNAFFTLIIIGSILIVWAIIFLKVRRLIRKIETTIEEPKEKKPRRGRYVKVSELEEIPKAQEEEPPKKITKEKKKKKRGKKTKEKPMEKEEKSTDFDSLLEEEGLSDNE